MIGDKIVITIGRNAIKNIPKTGRDDAMIIDNAKINSSGSVLYLYTAIAIVMIANIA